MPFTGKSPVGRSNVSTNQLKQPPGATGGAPDSTTKPSIIDSGAARSPVSLSTDVATEILAISRLQGLGLSPEDGKYFNVIESLEQLKIEDVRYIIGRALEEDPSGTWSALKKSADDDLVAAKKFVEDLNTFLSSIERLIGALDVLTHQESFEEKFSDFLSGKLDPNLSSPSSRPTSIRDIISVPIDGLPSHDVMLLLLRELRVRSTAFNSGYSKAAFELTSVIGQFRSYDPNSASNYPWAAISKFAQSNGVSELLLCIHSLSSVFNLSAGIARASSIQSQTGLEVRTAPAADKVFDGVRLTSVNVVSATSTRVVSDGALYTKAFDSLAHALKIVRHDLAGNEKVIPSAKAAIRSGIMGGEKALIRDPVAAGDLSFDELGSYSQQLEKAIPDLQRITESLVGFLDGQNELTPIAIFRRVLESFSDALALAETSDINKFQLLALQSLEAHSVVLGDAAPGKTARQLAAEEAVRTAAAAVAAAGDDRRDGPAEAANNRLRSATEELGAANAAAAESTAAAVFVVEAKQFVLRCLGTLKYERLAPNTRSTTSSSESSSSTTVITTTRTSDGSEVVKDDAAVKTVQSTTSAPISGSGTSDRVIARAASDVSDYTKKAEDFTTYVVAYGGCDTRTNALAAFKESRSEQGTIFGLMVDLYDDLTSKSVNSSPDGATIVGPDGYTVYGKMDEYAVLSLIVTCFSYICQISLPRLVFSSINGATLGSASSRLQSLILSAGPTSATDEISGAYDLTRKYVETYQNVYAFLNAYSINIKDSRLAAVASLSELSKDLSFSSDSGRLAALSQITPHGVAVRRACLRKWEPIESQGYLPRNFSVVAPVKSFISAARPESIPNCYSSSGLRNMRVLHIGIPVSTISGQSVGRSDLIKVVVGRLDHRYNFAGAFIDKEYIFDPALFLGELGSSYNARTTQYFLFDRNGFTLYSYNGLLLKYKALNPDVSDDTLLQVILNSYNSAILEKYHYYTAGLILDESTSTGIDASISATGLSALTLLSNLGLQDVSLPPGSSISSSFQNGYINFKETASGVSPSKKEILSNIASSYLLRSSRVLDRIARGFDHDRVFLVPVDPDSFIMPPLGEVVLSRVYGLGTEEYELVPSREGIILKNQDPFGRGASACSFHTQVLDYRGPPDTTSTGSTSDERQAASNTGGTDRAFPETSSGSNQRTQKSQLSRSDSVVERDVGSSLKQQSGVNQGRKVTKSFNPKKKRS